MTQFFYTTFNQCFGRVDVDPDKELAEDSFGLPGDVITVEDSENLRHSKQLLAQRFNVLIFSLTQIK